MKKVYLFSLVLISVLSFAQDVKLKNEEITIDDKKWGNYDGCKMFDADCTFTVGDSEIVLSTNSAKGVVPVTSSNREGSVSWYEVKFLGTNKSFEIQATPKNVAKTLFKANVLDENNQFVDEKIDLLIEKYGHNFSDQYYNKPAASTVIINNAPADSGSGINIKIGGRR